MVSLKSIFGLFHASMSDWDFLGLLRVSRSFYAFSKTATLHSFKRAQIPKIGFHFHFERLLQAEVPFKLFCQMDHTYIPNTQVYDSTLTKYNTLKI